MEDDKIDLEPGFLERVRLGVGKKINRVGLDDIKASGDYLNRDNPYDNVQNLMDNLMDKSIFEKLNNADMVAAGPGKPLTYDDIRGVSESLSKQRESFEPHSSWVTTSEYKNTDAITKRISISDIDEWITWLEKNEWNTGVQTGNIRLKMRIIDGYFWTKKPQEENWHKKQRVTEFRKIRLDSNHGIDMESYYMDSNGLIPAIEDIINLI